MSEQRIQNITEYLKDKIDLFKPQYDIRDIGTVVEAGDGIARVKGLSGIKSQELVEFENGVVGVAFNLEENSVGIIVLGDYTSIVEGMTARSMGRISSVPVGNGLIGRVVNALGEPIDGRGPIKFDRYKPLESVAPGVIERQDVDTPVQTGIRAIDAMIPIGRGQRELIIGDRQTGKTAIAIDTIINQKGQNLICIYVAIGQKKSSVARTMATLEKNGALDYTVVVVSSADEPAALQYIAPYAGCAIGEGFMENGQDALIVYDDLSKHAWAYRQVSLLLRRPPGREAYPGDVFFLHSRLLERAVRLANKYVIVDKDYAFPLANPEDGIDGKIYQGPRSRHDAEQSHAVMENSDQYKIEKVKGSGGSLTALPIIETLLGDVSAYIPTNVISITDGQIYLESNLFNAGIRPAINVGISVSRVGGSAQTKAFRQVASRLKLDMASYRDLAAFAQFGSDLDKSTQAQLRRGQRLQEILKQPQYEPMVMEKQVILLYAATRGFADQIPLNQIHIWMPGLLKYVEQNQPDIIEGVASRKQITPELEEKLNTIIQDFNSTWT